MDSKLPLKAKVIMKEYSEQKNSKNAYVLFETAEQAKTASLALNQYELIGGNHIRVDIDLRDSQGSNQNDYDATVFIGNLPFVTNEEDLRRHFADVAKMETAGAGSSNAVQDGILNVRVVRDPVTHIGKGIAYIQFTSKMLMRLAIEKKTGSEFRGRQIRIKKAVAPQRLEKKKMRKEATLVEKEQKKQERAEQMNEDDLLLAQKGQDAYQSDDSFEERYGQKKAKFSENQIKKQDDLALHIAKIQEKAHKAAKKIQDDGLDITPRLGFNKKMQARVTMEKILKGKSKYQDHHDAKVFKDAPKLKDQLKDKIENKRKSNMKKINSIKIRKVKN